MNGLGFSDSFGMSHESGYEPWYLVHGIGKNSKLFDVHVTSNVIFSVRRLFNKTMILLATRTPKGFDLCLGRRSIKLPKFLNCPL